MQERDPAAFVAEFIGTFLWVLWIALMLSIYQQGTEGLGYVDFSVIGLVHGFLLLMLTATLGRVSGAHFNPAVTIALTALRRIRPGDACVYVMLQLAGAVAGALVCRLLLSDEGEAVKFGATAVSETFLEGSALSGMLAELLGTFVVMWAIMGTVVDPRGDSRLAPVVIGFSFAFAVLVIGPLTGAGLNPARAFGPEIVAGELFTGFGNWFVAFVVGPVAGALLAAVTYHALLLRPRDAGARPAGEPDRTPI